MILSLTHFHNESCVYGLSTDLRGQIIALTCSEQQVSCFGPLSSLNVIQGQARHQTRFSFSFSIWSRRNIRVHIYRSSLLLTQLSSTQLSPPFQLAIHILITGHHHHHHRRVVKILPSICQRSLQQQGCRPSGQLWRISVADLGTAMHGPPI